MKSIIEKSKYLSLIAVIALLLTFTLSLFWGVVLAFKTWTTIVLTSGQSPDIILLILKLVDAFLVAIMIYILAASIYELFVSKVELPTKLVARSISELKSKLSSVIVLVLVVHSVEVIFNESLSGVELVWRILSISLISLVLIAFNYFGASHE